jgi:nucleoside-diphosphate kinase
MTVQSERTVVLIKPDGMARRLYPAIMDRYSKRLELVYCEITTLSQAQAEQFYSVHREKRYFTWLVTYLTSGPVMILVYEGEHAVEVVKQLNGAPSPMEASAGTIRGDFGLNTERNTVHGSFSIEDAERELQALFISPERQQWNPFR